MSWLILWCEFQDHAALFGNANEAFPKGLFFHQRLIFCNESPTNKKVRNLNAFHTPRLLLLCGLSVVEATINEVNRGCIKTGREKDVRWRKNISAPVSQKERRESRFWIPEQFWMTWNQLQCTCQNSVTTPLSCHVYQKKIASKFNAYTSYIKI